MEIQEPLSFKRRRGSGRAGSRCGYADAALDPRWDWQKYEYSTRIWGRLLYNPDTSPEVWRRALERQFGAGANAIETALASVSRILPAVTTAYAPSAAKNSYWPELYFNQLMVDPDHYEPYSDSPEPRVFGNASPLDPELFLSMNEFAEELLKGSSSGKYSPVEVALWIEDFADTGRAALAEAEASASGRNTAAYRQAKVDIEIQAGLGEFFGAKFRSGVLFHLYEVTKAHAPLEASIAQYKIARAAWAKMANVGKSIYLTDITVGEHPQLRGHWLDRLSAIDKDIAALSTMLNALKPLDTPQSLQEAIQRALARPHRAPIDVHHAAPEKFKCGEAFSLTISVPGATTGVQLHYHHVDQAENYEAVAMERMDSKFVAKIPSTYTQAHFPLEYFFEITKSDGKAALHPGFAPELTNQPYFNVRST